MPHGVRNRSRDAQRQGTVRSRAGLGGIPGGGNVQRSTSNVQRSILDEEERTSGIVGNCVDRFLPLDVERWTLDVGRYVLTRPHPRVSSPPPKPLMIWDGDCHFCRRWIERWREITAGRLDYAPFQTAAAKFAEIPRDELEKAVQFIETDGRVFRAAEAVYRSLGYSRHHRFLTWLYDHVPGIATISEVPIRSSQGIALCFENHARLLWGSDVRCPTYFAARRIFLRALGLVYLIAFISLWVQVDGLIGANGISPVSHFLLAAKEQIGSARPFFFFLPTLCWFNSSDASSAAFTLRRRRNCSFDRPDSWTGSASLRFPDRIVCLLPLAHNRGTNIS